jgi:cell division septation protein DedD
LLAAVDTGGRPVRLDLRLGTVSVANKAPLQQIASLDGVDIFGVTGGTTVTRLTPTGGAWTVRLPAPVQSIEPQRDGAVLIAGRHADGGVVWRLRPPGTRITDSAVIAGAGRAIDARTPDRIFFLAGRDLTAVQSRTLQPLQTVRFDAPVRALAATPSGDRFYAALEGESQLSVLDRYSNDVGSSVALPGTASELRMDPLGRYVLARASHGDSAWIVAVGTDRVVGTLQTTWRDDLPLVLPDGALLTAVGNDAVVIDDKTLKPRRTIAGGASNLWHLVLWNGFRPRAAGLDQPVRFDSGTTRDTTPVDSTALPADTSVHADTSAKPVPADTARPPRPVVPDAEAAVVGPGFTVQFAAAGTEQEARAKLARLRLPNGVVARIVPGKANGRTVYRVVAGPFATRAAAIRVAKASGHEYWLKEGAP